MSQPTPPAQTPSPNPAPSPAKAKKFLVRTTWHCNALHLDGWEQPITPKGVVVSETEKDAAVTAAKESRRKLIVEEVAN